MQWKQAEWVEIKNNTCIASESEWITHRIDKNRYDTDSRRYLEKTIRRIRRRRSRSIEEKEEQWQKKDEILRN